MHRRKRRILKSLVLAFAVAAFAAPAALGEPRGPGNPDFWNYDATTGKKIADTSPGLTPAELGKLHGIGSPDDRPLYRGRLPVETGLDSVLADKVSVYEAMRGSQVQPSVPDPRIALSPDDRPVFRGVETPSVPVSVTVSSPSEGFEWSDAGLGAASTLALVLLMGAGTLLIRHQRRRIAAF